MRETRSSPLVGEDEGGGRPASAGQENRIAAAPPALAAEAAPPTQPSPTRGEGFKRLKLSPNAIPRARYLRRTMTDAERVLWRGLREAFPGRHWRKQVPFGPYTADFCSHRAKLIVEVDGSQHQEAEVYDAARTALLESRGYKVLRFWNNEVLHELESVLTAIATALPSSLAGEGGAKRRMGGARPSRARAAGAHPLPSPPRKGEGGNDKPSVWSS